MKIVAKIRAARAKRAAYNQTLVELRSMPEDLALELGVVGDKARVIARQTVYGG